MTSTGFTETQILLRRLSGRVNTTCTSEIARWDPDKRWLGAIDHASDLPLNLRGTVNMIAVSDSGYFEDLSSSLAST